jgi:hypothetical protein
MIYCKIIRSGEYSRSHLQDVWFLGHDVTSSAETLSHSRIVGSVLRAVLAHPVLHVKIRSFGWTADAGDSIEKWFTIRAV